MDDRAVIADLIARLAHIGDHGDLEDYRGLYTEDATWEYASGPVHGVDAIIANAAAGRQSGRVGPGSGLRHVVTTVAVMFPTAGIAESDTYILVCDASETPPALRSMVLYHDTLRRDSSSWRIAARAVTRC